jgi:MYXO-CTERM domain-containing protein
MQLRLAWLLPLAPLTLIPAAARPAEACGGCFSPPETITTVESHRMVVSLSPSRSILWDQIRYSGDPEDFVWVLPVPSADAQIAVADDLFFAELESQTAPQVNPPNLPPLDCPPPPDDDDNCFFWLCDGDGGGGASGAQDAGAGEPEVDVYREEVVGPYQTVVIGSDDPGALVAWLNDNGYSVPESTTPVIEHYTARSSVFVVLRLAPDVGVAAMQPIRVEYPGYMGTFPLKMVTVGAFGALTMTLWVIAEQRTTTRNYAAAEIDPGRLIWDLSAGSSNYRELFRETIQEAGGRAWITQFAGPLDSLWFESTETELVRETVTYPFLTRLETEMLVDHLNADLELGTSDGSWLNRTLQADQYINDLRTCPDYDGDGDPDTWDDYRNRRDRATCGCSAGTGAGGGSLAGLVALALLRRRRRRQIS